MIYLDNAATTKPIELALQHANDYIKDNYFNPSATYQQGYLFKKQVESARDMLLSCFNKLSYKCLFTSCGTESNNIAIFCGAKLKGNFVTSKGEHASVFNSFLYLKNSGVDVRFADINLDGSVNLDSLLSLIDQNTSFVSIMHVNNETGAINNINTIAQKIKAINPFLIFHSDGVQAFGKINFTIAPAVDLYSVSAHKIGGVKGAAALFYKSNIHLKPFLHGGGQEANIRSGTENVFAIKVFEKAAQITFKNIDANFDYTKQLSKLFYKNLDSQLFKILSSELDSSPYIISISAVGLKGQILQSMLAENKIICGTGSACSSKNPHSRILQQCGHHASVLDGVLRLSLNADISMQDAIYAINLINKTAKSLKNKII